MRNIEDDVAPPPRCGRPRDPERVRRIMEAAHSHFNTRGVLGQFRLIYGTAAVQREAVRVFMAAYAKAP